MGTRKSINSEAITDIFGLNSDIYHEFMSSLKDKALIDKSYEINLRKWRIIFTTIYGEEISSELFLKHTYFTVILRIIVVTKMGLIRNQSFEEIYTGLTNDGIKNLKIFEFNFLFWIDIKKELFKKVYNEIQGSRFEKQDLFSQFYQQIFFSDLRHKRGEFFTPTNLVLKMIDDFYEFGLKILDPACGSGNFLVNIIIKILNSQNPLPLKI
ncbi:MAG: N-6 DNA methylase, partial [Candidatus Lokiarchaeota archaeon]|nr:N-6 DNA methylase [Candidatus Lokiarchaeota archaeon]